MAITIFYSWQSDSPAKTNRNFIEEAIKKTIVKVNNDTEVKKTLNSQEVLFDKDTEGVAGTPPVTEVILGKISNCRIFIPDLTFVGLTNNEKNRPLPNPNVLIEYGWALKSISHNRIISLMNTAFGEPTGETLPFNMRHLRHPLKYSLKETSEPEEKKETKEKLINEIFNAMKLILLEGIVEPEPPENALIGEQEEIPFTKNPSIFLDEGEPIATRNQVPLFIPNVPRIFLRIIPVGRVERIESKTKLLKLIQDGHLRPMERAVKYGSTERNRHGAITYHDTDGKVFSLTQLFFNKELWGIDTTCLENQKKEGRVGVEFPFIPSGYFEKIFSNTLENYLKFAVETLGLELPLKFKAGATDVKGYRMATGELFTPYRGEIKDLDIVVDGEIPDIKNPISEILRPFFEKVWDECGEERPDREIL